ncbi:dinucleotide-utilizing enzyme possibly involved in molybdopterin or thiamin biosynthesis [Desulfosporosinus acidiphilus SJ4]|uniref:Dinucleotide-utilizing enzyme possibly involved in molybdopterin or thiamin biosynthesis n=1 Tax=Desulfosporosinus acidiphilus (strain DSM 22704 / JCM 16185 / SJ4) TaxID=646529 RepID=I4DBY9_DESAJ|nr:tRNA threonylcarbamoyladenosine dehydratase [Desulfosporosinus acidiphilus]AFM43313.1 dinucleotide-utilizing enzyme possibly involved in molybdopterin or thiamin biosynthesis [Desulfosporosinus acidiphilus SJ4]
MEQIFSRTELLIGSEGLEKLHHSTVLVFGIGGVGSYAVEALARAAIGHLILVDFDEISISNLNRQIHALHSTIGEAKVEVMKHRIKEINPEARVETFKEFISAENVDDFLQKKPDYVVDAIDTVSSKVILVKECLAQEIPLISSMGAGNRLTAENYRVSDISKTSGDPLAKTMRKLLRQEGITRGVKVVFSSEPPIAPLSSFSPAAPSSDNSTTSNSENEETITIQKRQTPGSISFVPSVVGLLIAGEVVRDLLKR